MLQHMCNRSSPVIIEHILKIYAFCSGSGLERANRSYQQLLLLHGAARKVCERRKSGISILHRPQSISYMPSTLWRRTAAPESFLFESDEKEDETSGPETSLSQDSFSSILVLSTTHHNIR